MHLALFLTYGNSLQTWKTAGILDRELALYRGLVDKGIRLTIVSYGKSSNEVELVQGLECTLIYNKWGLPNTVFGALLPFGYFQKIRKVDVLKTNQMYGAHVAAKVSRIFGKPWILRQGYSYVEHTRRSFGVESKEAKAARAYEARNVKRASHLVFSTREIALEAKRRYTLEGNMFSVVPNYVQKEFWSPPHRAQPRRAKFKCVFVGRFVAQKNLDSLIRASRGISMELVLIGDGVKRGELTSLAKTLGVSCQFPGRVDQEAVKKIMADADFFVLPSLYEGHPKALLEAMCFGIPVLASNCPGNDTIVNDNETGILVDPTEEGLRQGILKMVSLDAEERRRLGIAAREWISKKFTLEEVLNFEKKVINHVISSG